jgi:hypothetical protein
MRHRQTVGLLMTCIDQPECKVYFEPEGAEFRLISTDGLTAEVSGEIEISAVSGGVIIAGDAGSTTVWDSSGNQIEPHLG